MIYENHTIPDQDSGTQFWVTSKEHCHLVFIFMHTIHSACIYLIQCFGNINLLQVNTYFHYMLLSFLTLWILIKSKASHFRIFYLLVISFVLLSMYALSSQLL